MKKALSVLIVSGRLHVLLPNQRQILVRDYPQCWMNSPRDWVCHCKCIRGRDSSSLVSKKLSL